LITCEYFFIKFDPVAIHIPDPVMFASLPDEHLPLGFNTEGFDLQQELLQVINPQV
jgi:hypothetical protein